MSNIKDFQSDDNMKVDFEDIVNEYRIKDIDVFRGYLTEIWFDLRLRSNNKDLGINKTTFYQYYTLPGIISERLFNVFDKSRNGFLDSKEFVEGMITLFTEPYEKLLKLVFNVYDFTGNGEISRKDIQTVFSYIPLHSTKLFPEEKFKYESNSFNNQLNSQQEIKFYLDKIFTQYKFINKVYYKSIIEEVSSETFLFLVILFFELKPFTQATIDASRLKKINSNEKNDTTIKFKEKLIAKPRTSTNFNASLSNKRLIKIDKLKQFKTIRKTSESLLDHNSNELAVNPNPSKDSSYSDPKKELFHFRAYSNDSKISNTTANNLKILSGNINLNKESSKDNKKYFKDDITIRRANSKSNLSIKNFNNIELDIDKDDKDCYCHRCGNISKHKEDNLHEFQKLKMSLSKNFSSKNISKNIILSPIKEPIKIKDEWKKEIKEFYPALKVNSTTKFTKKRLSLIHEDGTLSLNSINSPISGFNLNSNNNLNNFDEDEDIISFEGYLYSYSTDKTAKKFYYKLINKDLFYYKNKQDIIHLGIQNLSGIYINKIKKVVIDNKEMFGFNLVHTKSISRFFLCESEIEYNFWVDYIKTVTGYEDLNETYEIKHQLGEGRYGVVKYCIQKQTGREAAIKIISKNAMDSTAYEHVHNEMEILKVCQHPNIIKLYDILENQEYIYIITELCKGGDLFDYLRKRDFILPEDRAADLIAKLARAIYYLHSYGIIHRDLKIENILMSDNTDQAELKILDFGLSKIIGPDEKCYEFHGTIHYAAPELLLGEPYDKRIDLWSLGIISYILVAGYLPFDDDSDAEVVDQIVYSDVPFPKITWKTKSNAAKNFVSCLLHKEPNKRTSIKDCINHSWLYLHNNISPKNENPNSNVSDITRQVSFNHYSSLIR